MARKSSKSAGILGLLGAAAAAWYFLDPRKGKERREKVVTGSKKLYNDAETQARRLSEEASRGLTTAVEKTGELAREGMEKISSTSHNVAESAKRLSRETKERLENRGATSSSTMTTNDNLTTAAEEAVAKAEAAVHNAANDVASKTA